MIFILNKNIHIYLQGDSGGPMLERLLTYDSINNRMIEQYRVVGIVSAGIGK